jgi:predicted exporter
LRRAGLARRLGLLGAAGALSAMGAYCVARFELSTDILHFLEEAGDVKAARLARQVADGELTRTVILSVEAADGPRAAAAAAALGERLRGAPGVAWVRTGFDASAGEAVYELYFPRRFGFLSDGGDDELAALLGDEGLARAAGALKAELASPMGVAIKRVAGADPLLAFAGQLRRFEAARAGPLHLEDGALVTDDGRHGVVFLASSASAFDAPAQRQLARSIDEAFKAVGSGVASGVASAQGGGLVLEQSALGRYAMAAEASIKADINRISIASTLGIVALCLLLFRSPRPLVLALLTLGAGFISATFATLIVFGRLHGLTWAFGASLLGVCIDYPLHLFNHHAHHPDPAGPGGTARRLAPGLLLGALTTLAGFAGLAWTAFPGLREFALFASVGIVAALLTTRFALPLMMDGLPPAGALQRRLAAWLGGLVRSLAARRSVAWGLLLGSLAVCAAGATRVRFDDDVRSLSVVDPALQAEDERVRARVSWMDSGRMVVAVGRDDEEALSRNDAVWARLSQARSAGVLEDLRSMHSFVWSAALQRRNIDAVLASPRLAERTSTALSAAGFRAGGFAAFGEALRAPPPPLTMPEVLASPLGDLARTFRVELDGPGREVALLTFVRGVKDEAALAGALAGLEGVDVIDQGALVNRTFRRFRRRTVELVALGLLAVWGLVFAYYRRASRAAAACAPAVLAAATTLSLLALAGERLNLLHVVATLLVLSMGVDYGIFLVESGDDDEHLSATMVSILAGCASTVLGFGLLAMSSNPALRAIGLTTGIGTALSLLLAPAGLVLARRPR